MNFKDLVGFQLVDLNDTGKRDKAREQYLANMNFNAWVSAAEREEQKNVNK